jgi:hypothetical protein
MDKAHVFQLKSIFFRWFHFVGRVHVHMALLQLPKVWSTGPGAQVPLMEILTSNGQMCYYFSV